MLPGADDSEKKRNLKGMALREYVQKCSHFKNVAFQATHSSQEKAMTDKSKQLKPVVKT